MPQAILIIDDDALLTRSLAYTLGRAGYVVQTAGAALEGLALVRQAPPDLVLLDIGLPGLDGLDALHILRNEYQLPVILLTARRGKADESLGLTLGADDYVKKPHDTDVLLARIAAVLRRGRPAARPAAVQVLTVGNLRIEPQGRRATVCDHVLDLTPRAFDLLYLLAREPDTVVPTSAILSGLWGSDFEGEPQVVYVHIRWLRERLADVPGCNVRIVTVHRVGYKLTAGEA
jgi:DNA-binding response OmpR family regulator